MSQSVSERVRIPSGVLEAIKEGCRFKSRYDNKKKVRLLKENGKIKIWVLDKDELIENCYSFDNEWEFEPYYYIRKNEVEDEPDLIRFWGYKLYRNDELLGILFLDSNHISL